ncbi:uncharacterized protein [Montipora foliosa]|uniref:uncharacterized protein n=1 Tax=Montipora foliosa TaxID=591990 RepID=UPI0035F1AC80
MMEKVAIGGDISEAFDIKHGVELGCVLAPAPFTLYLAAVLETMGSKLTRDDSALVSLDPEDMQEIVDRFSAAASHFGFKINVAKTELLYHHQPDERTAEDTQPSILVNGVALKTTESFTYLGNTVTATNSLDLAGRRPKDPSSYKSLWCSIQASLVTP